MSEDAHNPDGSPPSFVPAEERAKYWERRARYTEDQLELLVRIRTESMQAECDDKGPIFYRNRLTFYRQELEAERARSAILEKEIERLKVTIGEI